MNYNFFLVSILPVFAVVAAISLKRYSKKDFSKVYFNPRRASGAPGFKIHLAKSVFLAIS
ncbi:MAG: hypothetical protein LBS96_03015 [Oscillospiraceae bacterium]|jgi:hypothetical protein|nr:hypothetical protein [Oscillospiraceae bacterium]